MKGIIFAIIALAFISVNAEEYNDRNDNFTTEIIKNEWQVLNFAGEGEVLNIVMRKYDNSIIEYFYMVLLQNGTNYKMVAPWGETVITRREILEIKIRKICLEDMPYRGRY